MTLIILPLWLVVLILTITIFTSGITFIIYFLKGIKIQRVRSSRIFFYFLLSIILIIMWSSGQLYEVFYGKQPSGPIFLFEYFAVCFGTYAWVCLSLEYLKGKNKNDIIKKLEIILIFPPLLMYIGVLTNDIHQKFTYFQNGFRHYGILFYINFLLIITYVIIGVSLCIKYSLKKSSHNKTLTYLLAISYSFPISVTLIKVLGLIRFDIVAEGFLRTDFDITPFSFIISMCIFMLIMFKYSFMNLNNIIMSDVFNSVSEAIIVIDESNRILKTNNSFQKSFDYPLNKANNRRVHSFIEYLLNITKNNEKNKELFFEIQYGSSYFVKEICVENGQEEKFYSVKICPVKNYEEYIGKTVIFSDVSDYTKLVEDLQQKNAELNVKNESIVKANKKLKDYSDTMLELAVVKERNRLARDVHDTLGHNMVILITLLEAYRFKNKNKENSIDEILEEAVYTARKGLDEIRSSINGFASDNFVKEINFIEMIEVLIVEFELTGIKIDFCSDQGIENINNKILKVIYRITQESLTNSVKHGKADHISYVLKIYKNYLKVHIFDNGVGCKNIVRGMGLQGMTNRVEEVGGKIWFVSNGEGFSIKVEIPI